MRMGASCAASERDEAAPDGAPDGIGAVGGAKLAGDRRDVKLHRLIADREPLRRWRGWGALRQAVRVLVFPEASNAPVPRHRQRRRLDGRQSESRPLTIAAPRSRERVELADDIDRDRRKSATAPASIASRANQEHM